MRLENKLNKSLHLDKLQYHLFNLIPRTMDLPYLYALSDMYRSLQNLRDMNAKNFMLFSTIRDEIQFHMDILNETRE